MDNKVNFLRGTATEYEASTKDNDTFYYTTDDEKLYLGNKEITGGGVTIDNALSDTSKNPVQNKVINAALNNKANLSDIPTTLPANGGNADTLDGLHESSFAQNIGVWSEGGIKDLLLSCTKSGFVFIHPGVTEMPSDNMYWFGLVDCNTAHRQLIVRNVTNNAAYSISWNNGTQAWTVWSNLANGGNADTVDGKHADDFIYAHGYLNGIDLDDIKYPCSALAIDCINRPPVDTWGTLLVYAGGTGSFTQIYIPTGDDGTPTAMYFRHHDGTGWTTWRNTADGGNAATLESHPASDFALKTDIPTTLPANGGNADTVDGKHASDFMPISGETRKYGLIRMNASDGIRVRHIDGNDTEFDGALYLNYNSPNAPIYMNGSNTAIHSGNIGSQSVNYANSAGSAQPIFNNGTWYSVGDDVQIGDHNVVGGLGILGANGPTRIDLCQYGNPSNYKSITFDGTTLNLEGNADTVDGLHNWQHGTLDANGNSHGTGYPFYCKHNLFGDNRFGFYVDGYETRTHFATGADYAGGVSQAAVSNVCLRNISAGTGDLTAGSSPLATGTIYLVYE